MHNIKARDAFERGDTESALYHVNNSLRLYPQQPEVIRLREKITGQKVKDHERNLQHRVLERVLGPMNERHMAEGAPAPVDPMFDPAKSTSAPRNSDPYANDPWTMDTEFEGENWDFDSTDRNADGTDTSEATSDSADSTPNTGSSSFNDDRPETSSVENDDAAYTGDSFGGSDQSSADAQTTDNGGSFGGQTSAANHNDSAGSTDEATTAATTEDDPMLSERQRMSMEFLNSLYVALGLPPLSEDTNLTQIDSSKHDSSSDEVPFETFDEATGVTEAGDDSPY